MANSYSQLGIHFVTAVKHRRCLILPEWRSRIEAEMRSDIEERGHHLLEVHMQPDHVHALVSMDPEDSVSNLVAAWKSQSSGFIARNLEPEFSYQRGYGAFAISKSDWPTVKRYIQDQDAHHIDLTFRQEYIEMLERHGVDYNPKYLFDDVYVG